MAHSRLRRGPRSRPQFIGQSARRLLLEPLEDRRLLSLVGITLNPYPQITYDTTGTVNYQASTDTFDLSANDLRFSTSATNSYRMTNPNSANEPFDVRIAIQVNNSGNLVGPGTSTDLIVDGQVTVGSQVYTAPLLTGEATQFGYQAGNPADFDFRFTITGGSLASYFTGYDIGLTDVSSSSNFTNFQSNFQGAADGYIGAIPKLPSITTAPNTTSITLGSSPATLTDTAMLSGGQSPTGTITFTLYHGTTLVDTETAAVNGDGGYSTPTGYTLPTAGAATGTYQWDAAYSGDAHNGGASDLNAPNEQVVVSPASPAITTMPNMTSVTLGGNPMTLTDTAILSAGYSPTGTITFTLYHGTTLVDTETAAVNGDGSYSTPTGYTLPTAGTVMGTYQWDATYNGDANNNGASDTNAVNEQVLVSPASPLIATTPNMTSVTLGTNPLTLTDTAVLSAGYAPTGTIIFTLYQGTTLVDTETTTVNGDGSYSTPTGYTLPTTGAVTGTYQWDAAYSGDANNGGASDINAANEQVVVSPGSPGITTTPGSTGLTMTPGVATVTTVTLDGSPVTLTDTAVVAGGYSPTGTVTFTLYQGTTLVDTETAPINGDGDYVTPTGYTLPTTGAVTGTYQWDITYGGDANNSQASDVDDATEQVLVSPASPAISTTPNTTIVTLGASPTTLTDTAVLSSGYAPTGTITFTLYQGTTLVDTETATVNGDGSYSTPTGYTLPTTGTATGTYQWDATYNGDANNSGASDINDTTEQAVVSAASPAISTTPNTTIVTLGASPTTLADTAVLSGGYSPTGTITFTLYQGTTLVDTETAAVNGDGSYSTPTGYTLPTTGTATGTYQWDATYNGDTNNSGVAEINAAGEQATVSPASPAISTTPNTTIVTLGTSPATLTDTAVLSGGYSPTGTITFTLYQGTTLVDTEMATVNGNGTYSTPTGYTLPTMGTATGTYQWDATYNGDANNGGAADINDTTEQAVVSPASPAIATTPNTTSVTLGASPATLTDTAVLSGGYAPTGTITFTLYQGTTLVDTETATVNGDGSYSTPTGYTLPTTGTVAGTYQWDATYNGDANNGGAADINDASEQVVVSPASPAISTTPNATSVTVAATPTTLTDTAVLSGGYAPIGTITFTLYQGTTLVDTETATVNGDGSFSTPTGYTLPTTGTVAGTYQWDATYSGDANNNGVAEINAAGEQVVVLAPDLTITKTGDGTINSTDTATFTITVSNTGTGTAYGVTVSDPLPGSATLTWTSSAGTISGGTLTDAIGNLAAGGTVTIHVSAVTPAGYSGTLADTATATASNNSPASVSASATDIVQAPDLTITKTGNGPITSPATATFTITVSNTGAGVAYGVSLSDPLPDSATLTWTTSVGTISSGTLTDAIGNLAAGATVTIQVSAATAGFSGTLSDTATATAGNNSPASVSASATIVVQPSPSTCNLSITKTDGVTSVAAGSDITYTITVTNNGPNTVTGATVSDPLPAGTTFVSVGGGGTYNPTTDTVTYTTGTLAASGTASFTVTVEVNPSYSSGVCQTCDFTTLTGGANNCSLAQEVTCNGVQADAFSINNSSYLTSNTNLCSWNATNNHGLGAVSNSGAGSVIRLTKAAGTTWTSLWVSALDSYGWGGTGGGTLYWSNSPTPNLSTLSADCFTFNSATFGNNVEGNLLSVAPANFDPTATYLFFCAGQNPFGTNNGCGNNNGCGDNGCRIWKVTTTCDLLTNTATVTPPAGFTDTNPVKSASCTNTVTPPQCNLSITKSDGVTSVAAGSETTYTITVTNDGPSIVTGATVSDPLPAGTTFISVGGGATYNSTTNTVTYTTGTLADLGTASFTVTLEVNPSYGSGVCQTCDFTTLTGGGNNCSLAQNVTCNGVQANAFAINSGSYLTSNTNLCSWNQTNNHGLGVISNNGGSSQVIRLTKAAGTTWTSLWVSALDSCGWGGTGGGTLYWSNSPTPNLSTLGADCFTFNSATFGNNVEGNLLSVAPANFDPTATYLFFCAGQNPYGNNNGWGNNNGCGDNGCRIWKVTTTCDLLTNTATVTPPAGFIDTNLANNSASDTDTVTITPPGPALGHGASATTTFWDSKSGQALIKSFNGSASSTALGNWLSGNFPNLFGSFAGLTNTQIAARFVTAFGNTGTVQGNTYAQTFAIALSVYATTSSLGGAQGTSYGFTVSSGGTGALSYNVGGNGAAFAVSNNTPLNVATILQVLNNNYNPTTGLFYGGSQSLTTAASNVAIGVNQGGNINATLSDLGTAFGPADIRTAYGINNLSLDGSGQTIAIVDAYDDPDILQSVDSFDNQFGTTSSGPTLYQQYGPASSFLTVLNQNGLAGAPPSTDPNGGWEIETALDVEWTHAMAPGANIVLVEANSQSLSDLMSSVAIAANQPGVSVVSMSWGFAEGLSVLAQDEAQYDSYMTTPAGHQGVTFVASTGDYGTADPEYPAFSPNVVAVGGTSLYVNSDASYNSETGWGYYSDTVGASIGSGGGISMFEPEPIYQQGVQSTGFRTTPDVSLVADPNTGAWIADTYNLSVDNPWEIVGGTSLSAPCWAGIFALVNQGRAAAGQPTLNSTTPTDAQQALYSLPQADFNSITSGNNGLYTAAAGYNLVTGLGTPVAGLLVPDLVAYQQSGDINTTTAISVASFANYDATEAGMTNALAVTNAFSIFDALTATANAPLAAYRTALASPGMPSNQPGAYTAQLTWTQPPLSTSAAGSVVTALATQPSFAAIGPQVALNQPAALAVADPLTFAFLTPVGTAASVDAALAATGGIVGANPADAFFSALGSGTGSALSSPTDAVQPGDNSRWAFAMDSFLATCKPLDGQADDSEELGDDSFAFDYD